MTTKLGHTAPVLLRIYLPEQLNERWVCRYEIDWPEDGWPAQTAKSHAFGSDALHALQLAIQKLGLDLHSTSYHKAGKMHWDDWNGYGIALPKEGRNLMRGDDAKFYG
ncbi:MAG: hypothetical protein EON56_05000 [Alphaproteobacteria bacterium]|nr:MAG: hypothetical protein EON56_05000 [Alphaproteobacteria bacterium]